MTDVDDWESDDPFRDADPDPEPNCHPCYDSGWYTNYNKRKPLFGRPRRARRCPGCNPTWLQRRWQKLAFPVRNWWRWRQVSREPATLTDDPWKSGPPF